MAENNKRSFLGTGWGFPPEFIKGKNGVVMVSDEEDIRQSLQILLATIPGERMLRPKYGANLEKLLFEPLDTTLKAYMKDLVKDAILFHEPRVILNRIELEPDANRGLIEITVDFTIRTTNTRTNLVFPFLLNEAVNT